MAGRLARIALALAGFAAALGVRPEQADASTRKPSEDDALLLELRSGSYILGEPVRGYQTPQGVCVDFADAIQSLDVPVRLDKKSRRATGWFFAEDQRLIVDRDANLVQTAGRSRAIDAGEIHDTPEGWCIELATLSNWAGVRFRADLSNLAVVIESDRKLPFLEALDRKRRAARLQSGATLSGEGEFNLASLPRAKAPYQAWRTPSVDLQNSGLVVIGPGLCVELRGLGRRGGAGNELLRQTGRTQFAQTGFVAA